MKQHLQKSQRVRTGATYLTKPPKRKWISDPENKGRSFYKKLRSRKLLPL